MSKSYIHAFFLFKTFSYSCGRIYIFIRKFLQHFMNDLNDSFYINCIPESDSIGNVVSRLHAFNSFQATLLLVEVNSQVVFTQGRFMNAKSIQGKV